ncbi:hypothetical protein [Streptacidiphilus jiangxiensis]|uniref:Uncharacterized protein n=1 Tax=Streptacidiphilus jiangxiensis TaxID=235985 RepID=A0A1H8B4Q2_STRJI|nr:hypothetical protein [Streptacidiphilus jiangxiensis]SEM77915.1 hypothetical protein SAMN05414137_15717 [Streptacidiphilus jiangxiensis]
MTTAPLPAGWAVAFHRVHNLVILTLLDQDRVEREIGFHPLAAPGPENEIASSLDQITDPDLGTAARKLLDSFYARTARAQRNSDAFGRAFPDLSALFARLAEQVPGCTAGLDLDHEALALVLTAQAPRESAPELLALIRRWPGSVDGPASGVEPALTETGGLTLCLSQDLAEQFLAWFRDEP